MASLEKVLNIRVLRGKKSEAEAVGWSQVVSSCSQSEVCNLTTSKFYINKDKNFILPYKFMIKIQ